MMKRVIVAFDYEGSWGMPYDTDYDLTASTLGILAILKRNNAHAVFFVTGKLVEEYPRLIKRISSAGHEIGFHGYMHEHMHDMSTAEIAALITALRATADACQLLIGYRPKAFRAPYLMGPTFYDKTVYQALSEEGFRWVSNREIRWPEELYRPDRMPLLKYVFASRFLYRSALMVLNFPLILTEPARTGFTRRASAKWLLSGRDPLTRGNSLTDYPLYSPLDRDLLGFTPPDVDTHAATIAYATGVLKRRFDDATDYFSINCHDWVIGTANRLAVLDDTLAYITADKNAMYFRPSIDEAIS